MSLATWVSGRLSTTKIFYGWYIALAGAATNVLVLGVALVGFGVFITPMREELGWSVAVIAAGYSVRSFEMGFLSPVSGYLVDRLGPRKMALVGVVVLALGLLMFSQARDVWLFYLSSMIIALGQSLTAYRPFALALMNWFSKKRGRAMGLLSAGGGLSYFAAPVLAVMIGAFGWRATLIMAAAAIFALGIPLAMTLRARPEPYGYLPDGETRQAEGSAPHPLRSEAEASGQAMSSATGMSVSEALRTPAFYLLVLAGAASGSTYSAWIVHLIPHLQNVGFSAQTAGLIVGIFGAFQVVFRVGSGWLGDIMGRRRLFVTYCALLSVGLLIFANLTPSRVWLLPFFYLTYALGHATSVVLGQTMVADYFGTKRYATLAGLSGALHMPLGVATPIIAGWMFDRTGSYRTIFMLYAALAATGSLWASLIRRPMWTSAVSHADPEASPQKADNAHAPMIS